MSVPNTLDRIATILEGITGITSVYAGRPHDVPPANTPAFIVFTDAATAETDEGRGMDDSYFVVRVYRLILVVAPWVTGTELASEGLCRPFFDRVETAFVDRPMLELTPGNSPLTPVVRCRYLQDSGVINITVAGKNFAGVEFRIEVVEIHQRTYS